MLIVQEEPYQVPHYEDEVKIYEAMRDGTWRERANLPDPGDDGVAISRDFAMNAKWETDRAVVHVYQLQPDGTWQEQEPLSTSFAAGVSGLDLTEEWAVVKGNGNLIYMFEKQADLSWLEQFVIEIKDAAGPENLQNIHAEESFVIATNPYDNEYGESAGAVYVIDMSPGITSFTLIDTDTDQPVPGYESMYDGIMLDLATLPTNLSIRANVRGDYESVRFVFNGTDPFRIENYAPYALFGDVDGNFAPGNLGSGEQFLQAIPYTADGGAGEAGIPYQIRINVINGTAPGKHLVETPAIHTGVELPDAFVLEAGYPNPFNPTTTIRFGVPEAELIQLVVYDILGREVMRLVDGMVAAGWHEVPVDASHLPSGTYLYRLETSAGSQVRTMQLLK